jgi:hypothetical protein
MTKFTATDGKKIIEILAYTPAIAWSVAVSTLKTTNVKIQKQASL